MKIRTQLEVPLRQSGPDCRAGTSCIGRSGHIDREHLGKVTYPASAEQLTELSIYVLRASINKLKVYVNTSRIGKKRMYSLKSKGGVATYASELGTARKGTNPV